MTKGEKILAAVLIIIFLAVFYLALDANKYRAEVLVIEGEGRVGINPTTESLDFGDLSRGTSAIRRVDIENQTPVPMWIAVVRIGKISELMDLDKNYFVLRPGVADTIAFTVYMPASAQVGAKYTGRVFIFRIPAPGT